MADQINATFTPDPTPGLEEAVHRARILGLMKAECHCRRPYWIGGVPTEEDLLAARKAVARRMNTTPEAVAAALVAALSPSSNED